MKVKVNRDQMIAVFGSLFAVGAAIVGSVSSASLHESMSEVTIYYMLVGLIFSATAAVVSVIMVRGIAARRMARRVFIVYSHKDMEAASKISKILKSSGFEPWLDVEQLLPGQMWKSEIDRAIGESGATIVILSENLQKSEFARQEMAMVVKRLNSGDVKAIPVIPVRIDNSTLPEELTGIHWVDLNAPDAEERLLRGLVFVTRTSSAPKGTDARE